MNWFEQLAGFAEQSPGQVRSQLKLEGNRLTSRVNGNSWDCGAFKAPMLHDLRTRYEYRLEQISREQPVPQLRLREQVADVSRLHADEQNAGALFQVASQFNLLEMVSPRVTPEQGVGIYERDKTQGPACAIACGAGTIWRNYFMPLPGQMGQTETCQFDGLAELGRELGNSNGSLWKMVNGYALASRSGLEHIGQHLQAADEQRREALAGFIRVGIQSDTQVTLPGCQHRVSQVYCSALPVAYSQHSVELWAEFAQLLLDAAYEATFYVAMENLLEKQQNKIYLTLLGGGAFGNKTGWIIAALRRALLKFAALDLDVVIVSYGQSSAAVRELIEEVNVVFDEKKRAHEAFLKIKNTPTPLEPEMRQEDKRALLGRIIVAHKALAELLEKGEKLLVCPTCEQSYTHHTQPMDMMGILDRIQFMTGYNLKRIEGKMAMPLCYNCQTHIVVNHPVTDGDDSLNASMNGYRVYRRAKFGGAIHWVHI